LSPKPVAAALPDEKASAAPGVVVRTTADAVVVAAGQGCVQLLTVQPAGKMAMGIGEFLRGHRVQAGERMGSDDSKRE
jgi:methionyl-tRNA formyltransferase